METYWGLGLRLPALAVAIFLVSYFTTIAVTLRRRPTRANRQHIAKHGIVVAVVGGLCLVLPVTLEIIVLVVIAGLAAMLFQAGTRPERADGKGLQGKTATLLGLGFGLAFLFAAQGFARFQTKVVLDPDKFSYAERGEVAKEMSLQGLEARRSWTISGGYWMLTSGRSLFLAEGTQWFWGPQGPVSGDELGRRIADRAGIQPDRD